MADQDTVGGCDCKFVKPAVGIYHKEFPTAILIHCDITNMLIYNSQFTHVQCRRRTTCFVPTRPKSFLHARLHTVALCVVVNMQNRGVLLYRGYYRTPYVGSLA